MGTLTIGEVARRAGLRTSALRYYEEVGVLPPATRVRGQRRYDEAVLARLAVIRLAQELGFSVAEIRSLVEGFDDVGVPSGRWREMATSKLTEVDALITRAEQMKQLLQESLRCGCLTLDSCAIVLQSPQEIAAADSRRVFSSLVPTDPVEIVGARL
jgi:MerR family redox-sensitive transcriptional activator SoxR